MCFGAAASVWNFNRAADAVQMVLRALLLVLFGHVVNDLNGAEDEPIADSAHYALADFLALLGLQTNTMWSRWCSAAPRTGPRRSATNCPASKLAGRLTFFSQSVFSCEGRAAIKPSRATVLEPVPKPEMGERLGLRPGPGRPGVLRLRRGSARAAGAVRPSTSVTVPVASHCTGWPLSTTSLASSPYKGYGRDPAVNRILAASWGLVPRGS